MSNIATAIARANSFAEDNGIKIPVLLAPMAGASPRTRTHTAALRGSADITQRSYGGATESDGRFNDRMTVQ